MKMVEVMEIDGRQVVKLPDEFRFRDANVAIRKAGEAIILEPVRPTAWPAEFFHEIHIDDPAFERPEQGQMPPAPTLD